MAQCKWCGSKGLLVFTNKDGYCKSCQNAIYGEIKENIEVIQNAIKIVGGSDDYRGIIHQCDLLIQTAGILSKYENKGLDVIQPPPSEIIESATNEKRDQTFKYVTSEIGSIITKIESMKMKHAKQNNINHAIMVLKIYKSLMTNSEINNLERKIKDFCSKQGLLYDDTINEQVVIYSDSFKPFHTKVVGVTHDNDDGVNRQSILDNCKIDDFLMLTHTPIGPDFNAVKVTRYNGEQLGYLSAEVAEEISLLLDRGMKIGATISDITGGYEDKRTKGCNILLDIIE
jgi:hypothetical protein